MGALGVVVRAFSLGAGAVSAGVLGLALATAVVATAAGLTFDLRLVGLETIAVSSGEEMSSQFGPGLVAIGITGGVLNGLAALVVVIRQQRQCRGSSRPTRRSV